MIIVGLTGGIGSGKTTIGSFFNELGVPIYIADVEAKKLMNTDEVLIKQITFLLGDQSYIDGKLNRAYIANEVFSSPKLLKRLNSIVHPAVKKHFLKWASEQNAPYVIKEVAILFENGGHLDCDYTILVTAPKNDRIARVMKRDQASENDVIKRMNSQWTDNRKTAMADVLIENEFLDLSKDAVGRIHTHIMMRISRGWK